MASVLPSVPLPTNLAPLPRLLAYAQSLVLERHLSHAERALSTLALSLVWLTLAWRGSGRPHHLGLLDEPLLAALLVRSRPPTPQRSLAYFPAKAMRRAVEHAYRAELPRRAGRIWSDLDAHQVPYWGHRKLERFQKGWSGTHSRRLPGHRLYLAVDTDTGQVITFLLARGRTRDARLIALFARRLRRLLARRLAGLVADRGFTSRASVAALLEADVLFILGFACSAPIRARLAALTPQQRRWVRGGGSVRLGACPWDERLRLFALCARSPTDRRGPWVKEGSEVEVRGGRRRRVGDRAEDPERVEPEAGIQVLGRAVEQRLADRRVGTGGRLVARGSAGTNVAVRRWRVLPRGHAT